MSSEVIKVEITQKKIDDLEKANIKEIHESELVDDFDSEKTYIFEIIEDIKIPKDVTFGVFNAIVEIHTITNNGTLYDCKFWYIISSSIINNGNIYYGNDWFIISSTIINNGNIYYSNYWVVISSYITNEGTFDDCDDWILINSSSTNTLSNWYVHGYLQDTNTDNSNIIDNITNNKDEKLSKLLLLLLLNKPDNDLTHNINKLVK